MEQNKYGFLALYAKASAGSKDEKLENSTSTLDDRPPGWMWNHE
jgi:hypothetical protein